MPPRKRARSPASAAVPAAAVGAAAEPAAQAAVPVPVTTAAGAPPAPAPAPATAAAKSAPVKEEPRDGFHFTGTPVRLQANGKPTTCVRPHFPCGPSTTQLQRYIDVIGVDPTTSARAHCAECGKAIVLGGGGDVYNAIVHIAKQHPEKLTLEDCTRHGVDPVTRRPVPKAASAGAAGAAVAASSTYGGGAMGAAMLGGGGGSWTPWTLAAGSRREINVRAALAPPVSLGLLSYTAATDPAVRMMFDNIGEQLGVAVRHTTPRTLRSDVTTLCEGYQAALKDDIMTDIISVGSQASITTDGTSFGLRRIVTVTLHWLADHGGAFVERNAVLSCRPLLGSHSADALCDEVRRVLLEYGLDPEKHIWAASFDNCSANELAALKKIAEMFCVTHTAQVRRLGASVRACSRVCTHVCTTPPSSLSSILSQLALKDASKSAIFETAFEPLHAAVKALKVSPLRMEKAFAIQTEAGHAAPASPPLAPVLAPATRFCYVRDELHRAIILHDRGVFRKMPTAMMGSSAAERGTWQALMEQLDDAVAAAKAIMPALDAVSHFTRVTSSQKPLMSSLGQLITEMRAGVCMLAASDNADARAYGVTLDTAIATRFSELLASPYYTLSATLNPSIAYTLSAAQLKEGFALIKPMAAPPAPADKKYAEMLEDETPPISMEIGKYVRRVMELDNAAAAVHAAREAAKAAGKSAAEQDAAGRALPGAALLQHAQDPVRWWSAARSELPLLAGVFRRTATMQVSSIASERVFSRLKLVLGRLRQSLNDDQTNNLVVSAGSYRALLSTLDKLYDDTTEEGIDTRQACWDAEATEVHAIAVPAAAAAAQA